MSETAQEKKYLRRSPNVEDIKALSGMVIFISILIFVIWAFNYSPNVAVAKTIEPVYQNDYYCKKLKTTYAGRVVGAEGSIKELCAKEGVSI